MITMAQDWGKIAGTWFSDNVTAPIGDFFGQSINGLLNGSNSGEASADSFLASSPQNLLQDVQLYNAQEAALTRDWASKENAMNRQFQLDMSSSAYQRAAEDMRKAGLNPALMLTSGWNAASTGAGSSVSGAGGASASVPGMADSFSSVTNGVGSILGALGSILKALKK